MSVMSVVPNGMRAGAAALAVAFAMMASPAAGPAQADRSDADTAPGVTTSSESSRRSAVRSGREPRAVARPADRRASGDPAAPAASRRAGAATPQRAVTVASAPGGAVAVNRGGTGRTITLPAVAAAVRPAPAVAAPRVPAPAAAARTVLRERPACDSCWAFGGVSPQPAPQFRGVVAVINRLFDSAANWLVGLPPSPLRDFLAGALVLVRRTFFNFPNSGGGGAVASLTLPEIDAAGSPLAVRVDPGQQSADAIKIDAGSTVTLTLPGPVANYTVLANKPALVEIVASGNQIRLTATTPGFLGLSIKSKDGNVARYLGVYIADALTHAVPDTVDGYLPVGSVTSTTAAGPAFLEDFNFRSGVAPIDYLYIYDQGGADYTDGNLKDLLTQSARHGMVPVVVYYNIQNVLNAAGQTTGVVEGSDAAYRAINDYSSTGTLFDGYMSRYFAKLATDFGRMNSLGIPVQVVMEPDFLAYMATEVPRFQTPTPFVPVPADRSLNTAQVSAMYDRGLLTRGVDPDFPNTVGGLVQAVNYYVGSRTPNVRIGWKTNIWSVANQQNWSLGLLHMTDPPPNYPWQGQWAGPAPTWDAGRTFIAGQAAGLASFLDKVGVTSWSGAPGRAPFLAIDKYGVDGAYTYDPRLFEQSTAAFGNLATFVAGAAVNVATLTDADTLKYFGLSKADFQAFCSRYDCTTGKYTVAAADVQAVFTTLQNATKADPNLAMWFFNADQWNNYLFFVKALSDGLDGTRVMLWQIPQGHINGSTALPGRDLTNTNGNYEDSATSYFFGDSFTATGGRLAHFSSNRSGDTRVTVAGNTVTWGEHMTLAKDSGALSILFGAGLGLSTRGSPTPGGPINDRNFWFDKASEYLRGVA